VAHDPVVEEQVALFDLAARQTLVAEALDHGDCARAIPLIRGASAAWQGASFSSSTLKVELKAMEDMLENVVGSNGAHAAKSAKLRSYRRFAGRAMPEDQKGDPARSGLGK